MANINSCTKEAYSSIFIKEPLPSRLIDPSLFDIDFVGRKFLSIGLDPMDNFNVSVRIITSSSYIVITSKTLQRIFSMMGNILSSLSNTRSKIKSSEFQVDDTIKISKITRVGEIRLVFQTTLNSAKVLLTREDLIALQHMERSIFENISLKTNVIIDVVLRQLDKMVDYLKTNFSHSDTVEDMINVIRNVSDESFTSLVPNEERCIVSQLKIYADRQIAEKWVSAARKQIIKVIQKK